MTGGGFGGSAVAVVATDRVEHVADAVRTAAQEGGLRTPVVYVVTASDGARRVS